MSEKDIRISFAKRTRSMIRRFLHGVNFNRFHWIVAAILPLLFNLSSQVRSQETDTAIVSLKSRGIEAHQLANPYQSRIRDDGKMVAVILYSDMRLAVWDTVSGELKSSLPSFPHEKAYIVSVDFALGSYAVVASGVHSKFTRTGIAGSSRVFWTGGLVRTWKLDTLHDELSRFVAESIYGVMAASPTGDEVYCIGNDLVLDRIPIDREPRIRTRPISSIQPDLSSGKSKGAREFVVSGDGTSAICIVTDPNGRPGIMRYAIERGTSRLYPGHELLSACKSLPADEKEASDQITCATISNDARSIILSFLRDRNRIFVIDSETMKLQRTYTLSEDADVLNLIADAKGRIAARTSGEKLNVIDAFGEAIVRDRPSARGRTIRTYRIVGDTLLALTGGDRHDPKTLPAGTPDPSQLYIERIVLKSEPWVPN